MSRTLLQVPVGADTDEFVEVEVDSRDLGESVQLAAGGGGIATAPFTLVSSVDRILPGLSAIVTRLRSAGQSPDEISLELGLTVGGETGLVFTKGKAEATFTLTLKWQKASAPADPQGSAGPGCSGVSAK